MASHTHIVKKITEDIGLALDGGGDSGTDDAYVRKTSDYTVTSADSFISVDASSNDVIITLLSASGITGKNISIKRVDTSPTYTVTVEAAATETIDGSADYGIGQDEAVTIVSNGTNWEKKSSDAVHSARRFALLMYGT